MLCGFLNITIEKAPENIKCTLSELKHNLCMQINVKFSSTRCSAFPFDCSFLSILTNLQPSKPYVLGGLLTMSSCR